MKIYNRLLPAVLITGGSIVAGCGGDGYAGGSCGTCGPVPAYLSVGGVYEGAIGATPVIAIVAENGDGRISGQDGTYYHLTVATQANNVAGNYFAYTSGTAFPNGTLSTTGTVSAILAPTAMNGTLVDQTGASVNLSLNFDNVYNTGSSLPTLAGTWSYTGNGFSMTMTILSNGTFSAVDSTGCTYAGSFFLIDPNFDAYGENHALNCNGVTSTYSGLATYFPPTGTSVAEIQLLADDNAGDSLVVNLR